MCVCVCVCVCVCGLRSLCVCVCVCVRARMHAPNLTLYHMKMVLKAFSLEQEPQAIVMSWDIPLGATCQEGNSRGLPPPLSLQLGRYMQAGNQVWSPGRSQTGKVARSPERPGGWRPERKNGE